jgi:outer membrane protein assembly factor BamE (lipoprotein component of BamABCDE complex)
MNARVTTPLVAATLALALGACASSPAVTYLGDARFDAVHPGQTQDEVRRLEGAPASVKPVDGTPESEWLYPYVDSWGMRSMYGVIFDASGHVETTSKLRMGF